MGNSQTERVKYACCLHQGKPIEDCLHVYYEKTSRSILKCSIAKDFVADTLRIRDIASFSFSLSIKRSRYKYPSHVVSDETLKNFRSQLLSTPCSRVSNYLLLEMDRHSSKLRQICDSIQKGPLLLYTMIMLVLD